MENVGKWVKTLIDSGELEKFYHSSAWIKIAEEVKKMDNYECQICKREGKITTVGSKGEDNKNVQISVHHIKEVRKYPELALSIWYEDGNGKEKRNLITVCETHHNHIHKKFEKHRRSGFMNKERW